jgi:hypothetical protein
VRPVDARKLGLEDAALRAVNGICACVHERPHPSARAPAAWSLPSRRRRRPSIARCGDDDRQIAHREPATADGFRGELGALLDRAAEAVRALIRALPEEIVDELAVRAVQLDAIEAETLRIVRGIGIRLRHVEHFGSAGLARDFLALHVDARRPIGRRVREMLGAGLAAHALMPELRAYLAAGGVHGVDHALPARERLLVPEQRNVGVIAGAFAACMRALGKNEADFAAARRA